jgi:Uma2 family endonuclease
MLLTTETPYRFTVADYNKLGEAGIFDEDDRVELLDGEIIIMSPIGIRHVKAVRKLIRHLNNIYAAHCLVDCQNPFILDGMSEPQPDILLLDRRMEESDTLPGPADIFLIVEVAETSLGYDRGRKLQRYAANGIREVWIVNLINRLIEIYRDPAGESYRTRTEARPGESLAPAAFPDTAVAVDDILPRS